MMVINSQFVGADRLPIRPPVAGERIEGVACVREWTPTTSKAGNPYLRVGIGHRDGQVLLRVFESQMRAWEGIGAGDAVRIALVGRPGSGGFGPSWDCVRVERLDPSHPIRLDLLPPCPVPYEELCARWDALVQQLTPPAQLLLTLVLTEVGEEAFRSAPAAKAMHHAVAPHGLWWHSLEVAELAVAMAGSQPRYRDIISQDLLILGALLHDVGKVLEYDAQPGVGILMTPLSSARYHTTLGIQLVTAAVVRHERDVRCAGIPRGLIDGVLAVIESHHAQKEYGSPSAPNSAEAWLVHAADLASANLAKSFDLLATASPTGEPTWFKTASGRPEYVQSLHALADDFPAKPTVEPSPNPLTDHSGEADVPSAAEREPLSSPARSVSDGSNSAAAETDTDWITIIIDPEVM